MQAPIPVTEEELGLVALAHFGLLTVQEAELDVDGLLHDSEGAPVAEVRDGRLELRERLRWTDPGTVRAEVQERGWSSVHAVLTADLPSGAPVRPSLVLVSAVGRADDGSVARRLRAWRRLAADCDDMLVVAVPIPPRYLVALAGRAAEAYGAASHSVVTPSDPGAPSGGITVFFTGLSGAGKSTIARMLVEHLSSRTHRTVTLLDGDVVRTHLSKGLGFSREDRETNVLRIGWVAAEVTKHGGVAVCAPIAPYAETRAAVRRMVEEQGGRGSFVLVHVATPLAVCEGRDRKGLYAKARRGEIASFTGISDVYEEPADADVVVSTLGTVEESVDAVLRVLQRLEVLGPSSTDAAGGAESTGSRRPTRQ